MYTALIPTRTRDPYLFEALESVYGQTCPPQSVVVLVSADDAHLEALSTRVREAFPGTRVDVVAGFGMIGALNHGIRTARTQFLAFLDSDDLWLREKQERQLSLLASRDDLDAVYGGAANFRDSDGRNLRGDAGPSRMFTSTTFRSSAFDKYGVLDPTATHHTWLYRWWEQADRLGIRAVAVDYLGTLRRLHAANSWRLENRAATQALFGELRRIAHQDPA